MIARVINLVLGKSVLYVFGSKPINCSNVASPTSDGKMMTSSLSLLTVRGSLSDRVSD